jgi:ABC-type transport system involved in multi-copper enzyme maturation permease subunit
MIWLSWRQHRIAIFGALAGLVLMCAVLAVMGMETAAYRSNQTQASVPSALGQNLQSIWNTLWMLLLLVPLFAGLFLGAPLIAQDLEAGTNRLVWTQGLTRLRWLAWKLVPALAGVAVAAGALAAVAQVSISTQWGGDQPSWGGMFGQWNYFDQSALVLPTYIVFAVALGLFIGALIGRTLLAMVMTGIAYAAIRAAVATFLRPNYMPAINTHPPEPPGAWTVAWTSPNQPGVLVPTSILYQPADRFWTFQAIEAVIFVGLAALLIFATVLVVKRRTA